MNSSLTLKKLRSTSKLMAFVCLIIASFLSAITYLAHCNNLAIFLFYGILAGIVLLFSGVFFFYFISDYLEEINSNKRGRIVIPALWIIVIGVVFGVVFYATIHLLK